MENVVEQGKNLSLADNKRWTSKDTQGHIWQATRCYLNRRITAHLFVVGEGGTEMRRIHKF